MKLSNIGRDFMRTKSVGYFRLHFQYTASHSRLYPGRKYTFVYSATFRRTLIKLHSVRALRLLISVIRLV